MKKGKIRRNFNKNNMLSFSEFSNPAKDFANNNYDMFDLIPQGKNLREVVQRSIFKDPEGMSGVDKKLHTKLGSIVQDALDRISFLELSGKRIEEIADEFFWDNSVPDFKKPDPVEIPGAIGRGAIRTALNSIYSRLSSEANYFNSPNIKVDPGKLERLQYKMKNVESALAILDAQWSKGVIANKKYSTIKPHKEGFHIVDKDSYILSFKGSEENIVKLIDEHKVDLSQFDRIGFKKKGESYKTYKGNSYIEIKNPIMRETTSDSHSRYSKALLDVTDQARVEDVFPDDILQLNFIDEVLQVRKDISDNFSGAINNSKSRPLSKRVWEMNDAKEKSILNKFFTENIEKLMDYNPDLDEMAAADWLTRYLIKPQPLMSKYQSIDNVDGSKIDVPYYSMNNRLISSVYKYLHTKDMMPIVESIVKAQEIYKRGEVTEADDFVRSNYNMYQDGYNWDNLENSADIVKSLSGSGFYSPFWKYLKSQKAVNYTNPEVLKTFDNARIGINKKPLKDESGCR